MKITKIIYTADKNNTDYELNINIGNNPPELPMHRQTFILELDGDFITVQYYLGSKLYLHEITELSYSHDHDQYLAENIIDMIRKLFYPITDLTVIAHYMGIIHKSIFV